MNKINLVVFGLGGVGGFLGARLAAFYQHSDSVSVAFMARGKTLENVRQRGLLLDSTEGRFVGHPAVATSDAAAIGTVDYLLYCTKSYDVSGAVASLLPCIGPQTVIVPFMNGVEGTERLRELLPENPVWDGCVFIDSKIVEPGHILETTSKYKYVYGKSDADPQRLQQLDGIFSRAGMAAASVTDAEQWVWDKFAFISTIATLTSYTDNTYGEILSDPQKRTWLQELIAEFEAVAKAKKVAMTPDIDAYVMKRMGNVSADSTTSMQRDFRAGNRTELDNLTGYVIRQAHLYGIPVPVYEKMYAALAPRKNGSSE